MMIWHKNSIECSRSDGSTFCWMKVPRSWRLRTLRVKPSKICRIAILRVFMWLNRTVWNCYEIFWNLLNECSIWNMKLPETFMKFFETFLSQTERVIFTGLLLFALVNFHVCGSRDLYEWNCVRYSARLQISHKQWYDSAWVLLILVNARVSELLWVAFSPFRCILVVSVHNDAFQYLSKSLIRRVPWVYVFSVLSSRIS